MNLLRGQSCPPVVCRRSGPVFSWQTAEGWHEGDELPDRVSRMLPGPEWERCEAHRYRRMAESHHQSVA
ncbi:MAG: hypothetical protein RL513_498 [Pseudomonadota bacterium]